MAKAKPPCFKMFSQEQHFTDPIVSIITVDQQVMYEIYLHRILTKLLSVSFPMYSGDTGCGSHLQDGWCTQERPDFTDSSRDTLLLDRSVHQVGKVSCPIPSVLSVYQSSCGYHKRWQRTEC